MENKTNYMPSGFVEECGHPNDNSISLDELDYLINTGKVSPAVGYDEIAPFHTKSPFESVYQNEIRGRINTALATLTPKEADVIRCRFALNEEGKRYTLKETGDLIGKTKEGVRQIEAKAIRKLKHPSRAKSLKEFLD